MKHPFKKLFTVVSALLATFLFISTINFTSPFIGTDAAGTKRLYIHRNDSTISENTCRVHYWGDGDAIVAKSGSIDKSLFVKSDRSAESIDIFYYDVPSGITGWQYVNSDGSTTWNYGSNMSSNGTKLYNDNWNYSESFTVYTATLHYASGTTKTEYSIASWYEYEAPSSAGGWFTDSGCTAAYEKQTLTQDIVLYEKPSCNITLDKQNGSGGDDSVTAVNGSPMPSISVPSKTDCVFTGYFDSTSGGTQYYYEDGSSARNWDKTVSSCTLYAQYLSLDDSFKIKIGDEGSYTAMTRSESVPSGYVAQWEYSSILKQEDKISFKLNSSDLTAAVDTKGCNNYIDVSGIRYSTFSEENIYLKAFVDNHTISYEFYVGGISATARNAIVNDEFVKQMPLNDKATSTEYFCTGLTAAVGDKITILNGETNIMYSTSLRDGYEEHNHDFINFISPESGGINGIEAARTGYYDLYLDTNNKIWVDNNVPYYKNNYYWEKINSFSQIDDESKYYISDSSLNYFAKNFANLVSSGIPSTLYNADKASYYQVTSILDNTSFELADSTGQNIKVTNSYNFSVSGTSNAKFTFSDENDYLLINAGENTTKKVALSSAKTGFATYVMNSTSLSDHAHLYRPWAISDVTSISLQSTLNINTGSSETLKAIVNSSLGVDVLQEVTWESSDASTASVDSNGMVTAYKEGTCTITATSVQNNSVRASCTVTVTKAFDFTVSLEESYSVGIRESVANPHILEHGYEITEGSYAGEPVETFSSSDSSVAYADNDGKLHVVGVGSCTITYTVSFDAFSKSKECSITISDDKKMVYVKATEIVSGKTYYFGDAEKQTFVSSYGKKEFNTGDLDVVNPMAFTAQYVEYETKTGFVFKNGDSYYYSTPSSAEINASTLGNAQKYPWSLDGTSNYALSINDKLLKFTNNDKTAARTYSKSYTQGGPDLYLYELLEETISIDIDKESSSEDFEYFSPDYVSDKIDVIVKQFGVVTEDRTLVWSSSDASIATVDQTGNVSFTGKDGSVTITVRDSEEPWVFDTHTYNVTNIAYVEVAINTPSYTELDANSVPAIHELELTVTVDAYGTDITDVIWSSSDEEVATVDQNGVVTAIKAGSVTITATAVFDGKTSDSVDLTVIDSREITSVYVSKDTMNLNMNGGLTDTSKITINGVPGTDLSYSISCSDLGIASFSENNGVITVTSVSWGTATITITSNFDPSKTATIRVNVADTRGFARPLVINASDDLSHNIPTVPSSDEYTLFDNKAHYGMTASNVYKTGSTFIFAGDGYLIGQRPLTYNNLGINYITLAGTNVTTLLDVYFSTDGLSWVKGSYNATNNKFVPDNIEDTYLYFKLVRNHSDDGDPKNCYLSNLTVTYGDETILILKSISIKTNPTKVSGYSLEDEVDLNGLVITARYTTGNGGASDDIVKEISYTGHESNFTCSPLKIEHVGANLFKVTYTENGVSDSGYFSAYCEYTINGDPSYEDRDSTRDETDYGYYEKVLYSSQDRNYTGRYLIVYEFESEGNKYAYVFNSSLANSAKGIKAVGNYIQCEISTNSDGVNCIYTTDEDYFMYEFMFTGINKKGGPSYYTIKANGPTSEDNYLIGHNVTTRDISTYVTSSTSPGIRNDVVINQDNSLSIYGNTGFLLQFSITTDDNRFIFTSATQGYRSVSLYKWHSYYSDAKEYADGFKNYFVNSYSDEDQTNLVNYEALLVEFKNANTAFKLLNEGAQGYLKQDGESGQYLFTPQVGDESKIEQVRDRCELCMLGRYGLSLGMDDNTFDTLKNSPLHQRYNFAADNDESVMLIIIASSSILLLTSASVLFLLRSKKKKKTNK